jgi:hypothetical protein
MECRQLCQLAPAVKKRAGRDENSIGPLATKGFEGNIDLSAGVGVERLDVQPHDASSRVHSAFPSRTAIGRGQRLELTIAEGMGKLHAQHIVAQPTPRLPFPLSSAPRKKPRSRPQ